jgi:2'-5' RNA ligase
LHITTKFIGEWPAERLEELKAALSGLAAREPIVVRVRNLGLFANPQKPRIFWCGIDAPELAALAADTEAATAALGVPVEERPYEPHLTLARVIFNTADGFDMTALRAGVMAEKNLEFGQFEANRFFLYDSRPQAGGSVYTKLAEFPFTHP